MARFHPYAKPTQRIDAQYQADTLTFERMAEVNGDTDAAGVSEAHAAPMSPAEIQRANPPPTPPGVKRDQHGHIYVRSFEVK